MTCHSEASWKSLNMVSICYGLLCFLFCFFSFMLSLLCLCVFLWAEIHMHVHREVAQGGCTALSEPLCWPGLPWINCNGAYWSKLMQAFRYKEGAWCRKYILLQGAAPTSSHALVFRVISFHSKPAAQCAVSTGRCCLASMVPGGASQEGEMTSGWVFQLQCTPLSGAPP